MSFVLENLDFCITKKSLIERYPWKVDKSFIYNLTNLRTYNKLYLTNLLDAVGWVNFKEIVFYIIFNISFKLKFG